MTRTLRRATAAAFPILLLLLFPRGARGDEGSAATAPLTLGEAWERAEASNERLGIARAQVDESEALVARARAPLLPQISASASYVRQNEVDFDPASLFGSPGGTTFPAPSAPLLRSTGPQAVQPGEERILQGQASLALLAPEAWFASGAAGAGAEASRARAEAARQELLLQVGEVFLGTLKAQGLVEVARSGLDRARTHRKAAQARLAAGTVNPTAVVRARADEARASADLLEAEDGWNVSRQVLGTLIGLPIGDVPGPLVEPPAPPADPGPLEPLLEQALAHRPDLRAAGAAVVSSREGQWAARAHLWPSLGLVGSVQRMNPAPALFGSEDSWRAAAVLQVPIFQGGAEYAELSADAARRRQAELALEDLKKRVVLDVEEARLAQIRAAKVLAADEEAARLARENFRDVSRAFEEGLASALDLTDARTALQAAEQALVRQRYDARLAALALARATGTLTASRPPAP